VYELWRRDVYGHEHVVMRSLAHLVQIIQYRTQLFELDHSPVMLAENPGSRVTSTVFSEHHQYVTELRTLSISACLWDSYLDLPR
jgi:hypothetical protein